MPYYFYVLQSLKDGSLYKGSTENLNARLEQHNLGKTKSLKHRIPFKLIYAEEYSNREEAVARERWSKSLKGGKALQKLLAEKNISDAGSPARAGKPASG
ncbi:MAG: GIY-YIG nuclease family protein [candidate division Zixibacteria bacterium]|nr:GIY-YIG nuclease family protein [candidate division Zixibacteria bacterium]